jgi:hypothetical protein
MHFDAPIFPYIHHQIDFWLKIFSFPWIHGITHDHIFWASSRTSEWRTTLGVIPRFNINPVPSWWKSQTTKSAPLSWIWTPSKFVLSHFSELSFLDILLQVNPISSDKPKIVSKGFYEIENTSIFVLFSILGFGHYYCWLRDLIHRFPLNSKADYLVCTIQCILNFLQLRTIIVT